MPRWSSYRFKRWYYLHRTLWRVWPYRRNVCRWRRRSIIISKSELHYHFEYRDGHCGGRFHYSYSDKSRRAVWNIRWYGYRRGTLKGKIYQEHKLIWLYYHGEWPTLQVDHLNGIRDDNRIENLRIVTDQENQFNRKSVKGSSSKYKGVSWCQTVKKWLVNYTLNRGKSEAYGYFEDEVETAKAYDQAVKKHQKQFVKENIYV